MNREGMSIGDGKGIYMSECRNWYNGDPICNMINCFCMFSDYIPLTLDDWIRLDKGRRERTDTIQGHII